jgi:hypothetical protein
MKRILSVLAIVIFVGGCGSGVGYSVTTGTLNVLNGPTNSPVLAGLPKQVASLPLQDGDYALSPSKMTMTVTGIGFIPPAGNANEVQITSISPCAATYDRSVGSLALLRSSDITVPVGTFGGVTIEYSVTYTMVMNDSIAGIYSDPDAPGHLTTTAPAGGGRPIQIRDQNSNGDYGHATTYFDPPITIDKDSVPQIYAVFDPTHWVKATLNNGTFSAPRMGGNPPIIPSLSSFGKAAFYSNIGTPMSYLWGGRGIDSGISLLFLYADAAKPVSVTWQDHDICSPMGGDPVVAFNGNGTLFGTFGMLGLDASHTLAWASPGQASGDGTISGYSGVFKMPEISTIGQTTVVSYLCTSNVPQPVSGPNYSSGAPNFTAGGTLTLMLLEN